MFIFFQKKGSNSTTFCKNGGTPSPSNNNQLCECSCQPGWGGPNCGMADCTLNTNYGHTGQIIPDSCTVYGDVRKGNVNLPFDQSCTYKCDDSQGWYEATGTTDSGRTVSCNTGGSYPSWPGGTMPLKCLRNIKGLSSFTSGSW